MWPEASAANVFPHITEEVFRMFVLQLRVNKREQGGALWLTSLTIFFSF